MVTSRANCSRDASPVLQDPMVADFPGGPGCTTGKAAILDNTSKISNQGTIKEGLQATVTGLDTAIAEAEHGEVRNAMRALRDDYNQLLQAVNTGTAPDSNLTSKLTTDGSRIDSLCSIGTK
jgi:hypothetical protein